MKKTALILVGSFIGLSLMNPAFADDGKEKEGCTPITKIVYVEKPVVQIVTNTITKDVPVRVPTSDIVYRTIVETRTVTINPTKQEIAALRARYLLLDKKYKQLKELQDAMAKAKK